MVGRCRASRKSLENLDSPSDRRESRCRALHPKTGEQTGEPESSRRQKGGLRTPGPPSPVSGAACGVPIHVRSSRHQVPGKPGAFRTSCGARATSRQGRFQTVRFRQETPSMARELPFPSGPHSGLKWPAHYPANCHYSYPQRFRRVTRQSRSYPAIQRPFPAAVSKRCAPY